MSDIIVGVYHAFKDQNPGCQTRTWDSGKNLIEDPSLWTLSIPHAQDSGKCFTYKYVQIIEIPSSISKQKYITQ